MQNEKCFLTCIHCSSCQNLHENENFWLNFEIVSNHTNDNVQSSQEILMFCLRWSINNIVNSVCQEIDSLCLQVDIHKLLIKLLMF